MRVPPVYGSASDMYKLENSYLNNSLPQVAEGSKFHAHTEDGQTCIQEKLIIQIMINLK